MSTTKTPKEYGWKKLEARGAQLTDSPRTVAIRD
jgi:hypothetical protein